MTIRVVLSHKTVYQFDRSVMVQPHVVRLRSVSHCRTPIHGYSLKVSPSAHFINWQQDPFGNHLAWRWNVV
jgi:transglutaminase-like putative cysteine protease